MSVLVGVHVCISACFCVCVHVCMHCVCERAMPVVFYFLNKCSCCDITIAFAYFRKPKSNSDNNNIRNRPVGAWTSVPIAFFRMTAARPS